MNRKMLKATPIGQGLNSQKEGNRKRIVERGKRLDAISWEGARGKGGRMEGKNRRKAAVKENQKTREMPTTRIRSTSQAANLSPQLAR